VTTTTTTTGASTQLAPAALSVPGGPYDGRPWATYERISKTRSGRVRAGDGIGGRVGEDAQHAENVAYIHSFDPGASIVDFRDNASGWDPKVIRGDWEAMLTGLRAGQFKGAVAWHADRYTRQPAQLEQLISATDLGRAQLHTRMGGFHHDPTMIRIESALSWKESKVKSDRSKLKHGTLASEGKPHGGRRAYGWNEKRTKLIPHEAKHIRWVADQVIAGRSIRSITAELNERGAVTVEGKQWKASNLGTYLRRPMLAGKRVAGKDANGRPIVVGDATWPALLDPGKWSAMRRILEAPGRVGHKRAPRVYLLSGIARCGGCGGRMRGRSNESAGKPAAYFCDARKGCAYRRADLVDAQVTAEVVSRLAQVDATGALVPEPDTASWELIEAQVAEIESGLADLAVMAMRRQITQPMLEAATTEAGAQIADLRAQQADLDVAAHQPALVLEGLAGKANAAALFDRFGLERQRAVIELLCDVVIEPVPAGAPQRTYDRALVRVVWRS